MGSGLCDDVYAGVVVDVVGGERFAAGVREEEAARSGNAESEAGRDNDEGPAAGWGDLTRSGVGGCT